MKKYILLSITFFIFLISCNNRNDSSKIVLITTNFPDSTLIYLTNIENETMDSGYIVNNLLEFTIEDINEPTLFYITPIIKSRADIDYCYFWKENSKLTIQAEKGKLKQAKIEGSKIQKQAEFVRDAKAILENKLDSLIAIYIALPAVNVDEKLALRKECEEIENAIMNVEVDYIRNNPDELYSIITLRNITYNSIPKELAKELYTSLSPKLQITKYGLVVKKFIEANKEVKVGDTAINFQLNDIYGNLVELKNFEGKYILLDFWASNCGPCRMENPVLLGNYKAYRNKGFEILGVSLDKNKNNWENAVKSDSMIWTTVSDLKGFDGDVPIIYNINMVPTYFLINPEGIILEKIEGRGQLDDILKKIFE
ncbi:MAG: TlpA disulfide reductase family protein [Tenuifilum sp.]|uniref:TlpA family protein disulfide reductase n=1 Tax=Tenuifilum sp. TaxID=2760880 RepID=UPI0030AC4D81